MRVRLLLPLRGLLYFLLFLALVGSAASSVQPELGRMVSIDSMRQSLLRINEFSYKVTYRILVRHVRSSQTVIGSSSFLASKRRQVDLSNNGFQEARNQPPPITYPICISKSKYKKAFGSLSFPRVNQLPVYSWDGGPGCPVGKNTAPKPAGAGTRGTAGGGAATPLATAIDQLWVTEGTKLLPPPAGSFDPPTAITGARVYLRSRSLPSVSVDLAFHGSELAIHGTSDLWVRWSSTDPLAGPFPATSGGWPDGAIHHTYSEPGQRTVEITERWEVVWSFDGHTGVLPPVVRTTVLPLRVQTLRRILLAPT